MLEQLILYFIQKTKGFITKTQLVKFIYLADLYSVKWTGKQITDLEWYYYHYGPWQEEIDAALDRMEGQEIVREPHGNATSIQFNPDFDQTVNVDLPLGLKLMLDNIQREWAGLSQDKRDGLLEYVYNTAPILEVKDSYRRDEKVRLDLHKEREKLIEELQG
ncbi:type II toxin-antitoxin system antitoxin SocA domain-containing protein [Pannus brasiliensis CCIBt3594]|uniref:Type II toxin-antitoxin system antitoxin SocA domain-containing protein n=1 Tax=Pannus brasiliensis CCIBt3594 TaxID=1427578 RepID=A0AAW9QZ18_9CHRO